MSVVGGHALPPHQVVVGDIGNLFVHKLRHTSTHALANVSNDALVLVVELEKLRNDLWKEGEMRRC